MDNFELKDKYTVYDLEKIIALLRAPGGCPWDREQTHEQYTAATSLKRHTRRLRQSMRKTPSIFRKNWEMF